MADRPYPSDVAAKANNVDAAATTARRCLESAANLDFLSDDGTHFSGFPLRGLRVVSVRCGRILCQFRVPHCQTDGDGRWQAGAIAAIMDDLGAMTIVSLRVPSSGETDVSVELGISYFSVAKVGQEVEIEGRVEHSMGRAVVAVVEIRKKEDQALVAVGRLWMLSSAVRATSRM